LFPYFGLYGYGMFNNLKKENKDRPFFYRQT